jgi:hypothetical protein
VEFEAVPLGARAPASQRFTLSRSTLRWQGSLPPVVMAIKREAHDIGRSFVEQS